MRYLVAFILFLLLIWWAREEQIRWEKSVIIPPPSHKEYSCEELGKAMRYHGVLSCKQDDNYKWYFMRGKKKVYLFKYKEKLNDKASVIHCRTSRKNRKRSSKKQFNDSSSI
jgi:hypothetical protein